MAEVWNVSLRETLGTQHARRLRKAGQVPAVLYGRKKENVSLTIPAEQIERTIRQRAKMVTLRGAIQDTALIREVQWNAFGTDVLHIDLTRVVAGETVEVSVLIELRGESPGTKEGGRVEHLLRQVQVECPAGSIPEQIEVTINELHLGQSLAAKDLPLPPGARLLADPEEIVVQCTEVEVLEEEVAPAAASEPELIGRKEEEEEQQEG